MEANLDEIYMHVTLQESVVTPDSKNQDYLTHSYLFN